MESNGEKKIFFWLNIFSDSAVAYFMPLRNLNYKITILRNVISVYRIFTK